MRTLNDIIADVESGLHVWPDGNIANGPSGEPYVTFCVGRVVGGMLSDDDLIARMHGELIQYRKTSRGKFISWRKPLTFEDGKSLLNGGLAPSVQRPEGAQRMILDPEVMIRDLRCRVLITAYETAEQRHKEIMEGSNRPLPTREDLRVKQ